MIGFTHPLPRADERSSRGNLMDNWVKHFTVGAAATLALALIDVMTTEWLYGGLLGTAGQAIIFLVLALGALATLLLPLAILLAIGGRFLTPRPLLAVGGAALLLGLLTLLLNVGLWEEHPLFTVGLVIAGGVYGAGLVRLERGPSLLFWGVLPASAVALFLVDATQLRGLYVAQHLTVGAFCWLAMAVLFRRLFSSASAIPSVLAAALTVPVLLATAVFWSAPGDAIGENLRYALHNGSTTTRNALQLLAFVSDWDGDGYPVLMGRGDCEPWNDAAHPGAAEIVGDGIDQNCLAGDPTLKAVADYRQWAQPLATADLPTMANVIFITVDALRFDRVAGPNADPVLADIAADGIFFGKAYCLYPGTIPSLYGMAVSDYPSAIPYTPFQSFEFPSGDTRTTLFQVLAESSIRQFAAVYHMMLSPRFGITRGLDQVWSPADSAEGISARRTTAEGLAFLDRVGDERFFLWLHYFDPHAPYEVLEGEASGSGAMGRYDAEVARSALEVERFLGEVAIRGLSPRTAIILAADHGEEFGDHGATHHGQALYEESTHVPLILLLPSGDSKVISTPVSLLDLAPTILDLYGLESATPSAWKGRTLAPHVVGESVPRPFPVYLEAFRPGGEQRSYGVVVGDHKLLYRPALELFEFYDLASDPDERRNLSLYDSGEAIEGTLRALLDLHLATDY